MAGFSTNGYEFKTGGHIAAPGRLVFSIDGSAHPTIPVIGACPELASQLGLRPAVDTTHIIDGSGNLYPLLEPEADDFAPLGSSVPSAAILSFASVEMQDCIVPLDFNPSQNLDSIF